MGSKIISYGAKTERSTDGGTTWVTINNLTAIALPEVSQDYAEATSLSSPGGFKEYIPGMKDAGEVTLPGFYTKEGYEEQLTDQNSGALVQYRTTLKMQDGQTTTGDVFKFDGYPRVKLVDNGLGEAIGMEVTIRTTGEPTFTAGS